MRYISSNYYYYYYYYYYSRLRLVSNTTSSSRQRCGFSRKLLGNASQLQSALWLKTAKKCLHSRPVWLKSGQLHLGILSSPPKDTSYQTCLDLTDATWNSPLLLPSLISSGLISSAADILFIQWDRHCLGLSCRYLGCFGYTAYNFHCTLCLAPHT